jgi:hypothetical protein
LGAPAKKGATKLNVPHSLGFEIGDHVRIAGQTYRIIAFGSIIVDPPLHTDLKLGAAIVKIPAPTCHGEVDHPIACTVSLLCKHDDEAIRQRTQQDCPILCNTCVCNGSADPVFCTYLEEFCTSDDLSLRQSTQETCPVLCNTCIFDGATEADTELTAAGTDLEASTEVREDTTAATASYAVVEVLAFLLLCVGVVAYKVHSDKAHQGQIGLEVLPVRDATSATTSIIPPNAPTASTFPTGGEADSIELGRLNQVAARPTIPPTTFTAATSRSTNSRGANRAAPPPNAVADDVRGQCGHCSQPVLSYHARTHENGVYYHDDCPE